MKQVVVIGGGDAFATYDEYLNHLKTYRIDNVEYFKRKSDWKAGLQAALGPEYEVLIPQMPSRWNAKYLEWKIWLERMIPFLQDDVIFIGHSLGASFLAQYLSKEQFPRKIAATFLVAAPYRSDTYGMLPEFAAPESLALLGTQGGNVYFYASKDDPVVSYDEFALYRAALPTATYRTFTDRGHFNQDEFPELVADIKSLA